MKKPVHAFIFSIGLVFCLTPTYTSAQCWQQLGADFDGEEEYANAGYSLSLSDDGLTVAYGAPQNNLVAGKTTIFTWDGNSWIQKGADLIGLANYERSGTSIDLSADGNTIVIGATGYSGAFQYCGAARIYKWNGNSWQQQGNSIVGQQDGEGFAYAVSMSEDGETVAIGAPLRTIDLNTWSSIGLVRVYHWNGNEWVLVGSELTGQAEDDWFGSSVSLNSDGNYLAVGAKASAVNGSESGYAKVFHWNNSSWTQVGDDFIGEQGESLGSSLKLTPDAQSIVIGSPLSSQGGSYKGKLRVFDLVNNFWVQRGSDLNGSAISERFGHSVSISNNGIHISAGSIQSNANGSNSGKISAFYWDGISWQLTNEEIDGEAAQNFFGATTALSGNGGIIAGGAYGNDAVAESAGHVRVFSSCVAAVSEQVKPEFTFYPNPSMGTVETDLGKFYQNVNVQVKNTLGQTFSNHTVSAQQLNVELPENPGTYFIEVKTETGTSTQKIIKL
jgi:Secretion system C-terminal sorting domain